MDDNDQGGVGVEQEQQPRGRRPRYRAELRRRAAEQRRMLDPAVAATLEERRRALRSVSGGAYYRVSRTHPLPPENQGTPEFLGQFDESPDIDDLKVFFRHLALTSHWGNGRFLLEACAKGQRGVVLWSEDVSLGDMPEASGNHGGGSVASQIAEVGQVVSAVRGITGDSGTNADAMARLFTAGVAAGKGPDATSPILAALAPAIAKIVERVVNPPEPPRPVESDLDRTLKLMDLLGFRRQADPAATAADPMAAMTSAINTARAVVDAASGLTGGARVVDAAPRLSTGVAWAQAAATFMPLVVQAIGQITGTVHEVIEARKLEHLARVASARPVPQPQPDPSPAGTAVASASTSPLAGFEHAISEGIHTADEFARLRLRLEQLGHGGVIPAIQSGQVTADAIITDGRSIMPELDIPGAHDFVRGFVEWVKTGAPPARASGPNGPTITVECTRCHAQGPLAAGTPLSTVYCNAPTPGTDPPRPCGGPVVRVP